MKGSVDRGWERGKRSSLHILALQTLVRDVHLEQGGLAKYANYTVEWEWQCDGRGVECDVYHDWYEEEIVKDADLQYVAKKSIMLRSKQPAPWPVYNAYITSRETLHASTRCTRTPQEYSCWGRESCNLKHETRSDTHVNRHTHSLWSPSISQLTSFLSSLLSSHPADRPPFSPHRLLSLSQACLIAIPVTGWTLASR